jgi:hypothetical protein
MANYPIVAGTTAELRFQLLEAGAPINLLACTVTLLLSDRNGNAVANPGTVTITDSDNGKVQLVPASITTFVAGSSPYTARWKIVHNSGAVSYVPTGHRDIWEVVEA